MLRDADFGIVRVRAFGTYDVRISEPKRFLKEVAGSDQNFRLDEFAETMRSRLVSVFSDALATAKIPVMDLATRYGEVGEAILPLINPVVSERYGIEITGFVLENASVPPEVEQAIDKRSSMGAIGNLNDYVKYQMGLGMAQPGGGGAAGTAAELAVGLSIAQEMMRQQGGPGAPAPAGASAAAGSAPVLPEILSPEDVAKVLGVTPADVISSIEAGDLKGKKIGSAYRVTRAALDDFLKH
jgi:excisionase family DNA binding protein